MEVKVQPLASAGFLNHEAHKEHKGFLFFVFFVRFVVRLSMMLQTLV
jgi:hypothetical protein